MIQDRFKELSPYLKGIKTADQYSIIEAELKNSWSVPENENISHRTKETEDPNITYYLFYGETSIDLLLDWLEKDVIKTNLEIEQKEQLLREKVRELKTIFNSKNLDELKKLKFTFKTEDNLLKLNNKEEEKVEDVSTQ